MAVQKTDHGRSDEFFSWASLAARPSEDRSKPRTTGPELRCVIWEHRMMRKWKEASGGLQCQPAL